MKKNNALQFIRSLIFFIIVLISSFFYSLLCLAAFPLPLRYRQRIVYAWPYFAVWLLKIICQVNYRIDGLENLTQIKNGVVLSKHQSAWETFFLSGFFKRIAIITKRELLWIPFWGWAFATAGPIAINRSKKATAMSQIIKQGKKRLDDGQWVLVFPEGTRIAPGRAGKYHLGGARLAIETGYPVLPIAHNAGYFWPKKQFMKHPGTVHVIIGPPIETKGKTAEEVMTQAKQWIEGTISAGGV